jgi:hypothetical protein
VLDTIATFLVAHPVVPFTLVILAGIVLPVVLGWLTSDRELTTDEWLGTPQAEIRKSKLDEIFKHYAFVHQVDEFIATHNDVVARDAVVQEAAPLRAVWDERHADGGRGRAIGRAPVAVDGLVKAA